MSAARPLRLLLSGRQLSSLSNLDSARGWEGQWTALGGGRTRQVRARKGVSLGMGEGASWAAGSLLPPSLRRFGLRGFRMRLSGSILAQVLSEGRRSDVSEGLWRPAVRFPASPPSPSPSPLRLLPCAVQLAGLEAFIRRPLWLLSLVAAVFSASPSAFPRRLGVREQEAAKHWE